MKKTNYLFMSTCMIIGLCIIVLIIFGLQHLLWKKYFAEFISFWRFSIACFIALLIISTIAQAIVHFIKDLRSPHYGGSPWKGTGSSPQD